MNKLVFATVAALGITGTALAQQAGQQPAPAAQPPVRAEQPAGDDKTDQVTFETADKNKDGTINPEEGNAIDGFDFSRADTNDDEILSRQEYQAAIATSTPRGDGQPELSDGDQTAQVRFERADTDRNGVLSNEEANDIPGFDFSRADVNDDEQLSRQEFQSAMASSQPGV
jgi:Ca2+-binding EF-hand superfamily protein